MIKSLIQLIVGVWIYSYSIVFAVGVSGILGIAVDGPVGAPSGVCGTSFSMTSDGFFSTGEDTTIMSVGLGTLENSNAGLMYVTTGNSGTGVTLLYKVDMPSLTQLGGTVTVNAAPNNPDAAGSLTANYYDTNTGKFTVIGNTTATTCNAGTQTCFHIRTYSGGALSVDVTTTQALDNGAPAPTAQPTFDASGNYWYIYRITPAGTQVLAQFNSSFTFVRQGTVTATSNFGQGAGNDDTFVYVTQDIGPSIIRYAKSDISAGSITFSPGFAGGNSLQALTADPSVGFLYQPSRGTGATSNFVYRVRTSNMTIADTLVLGISQFMGKVLVDSVNDKLYVISNSGATTNQIVRLNRTTFASEATFNGGSSANGIVASQAQIDVPHQKIYVPITGTGGGGVAKVEKVNLCS